MTFEVYQKSAKRTMTYKDKETQLICGTLGLAGEAGEVAEKVKKAFRDSDRKFLPEVLEQIKLELGDLLWYIAIVADYFKIPLEEVAASNIAKLESRKERGKIGGTGDFR